MAVYEVCFGVAGPHTSILKSAAFQRQHQTHQTSQMEKNAHKLEKLTNILTAHHIIDRPARKYVSAVSTLPFCFLNLDCEEN